MVAVAASSRRRDPAAARSEIIQAARLQLAEAPEQINVSAIMARTDLARKTFYVHFSGIPELVTELVTPLRTELDARMAAWLASDDDQHGVTALEQAADMFVANRDLLSALWWSGLGEDAARLRRDLVAPIATVGSELIRRRRPDLSADQAEALGHALAVMNVQELLHVATTHVDRAQVLTAVATVWSAVLLTDLPSESAT